jgi:predicted nucleic acid-binding protein
MKPTRFVADASVAIAWVHPGQATASTQAMLEAIAEGAVFEVPSLWLLEVANVLLVLRRRGRITERERRLAAEHVLMLPHVVDGDGTSLAFTRLSELAAKYRLSIYDAVYLELAMRRNLPLATKDGPLSNAARKARVATWPVA